MEYKCHKCGETENLHFNLDYTKQHRPVLDVLCNECGEFFGEKSTIVNSKSKHWSDVLNWIQTVIDSCKTITHVKNCEQLIRNFHRIYEKKLGGLKVLDLTREMERKLWDNDVSSLLEK